jgi:hypothetical protein
MDVPVMTKLLGIVSSCAESCSDESKDRFGFSGSGECNGFFLFYIFTLSKIRQTK